MNNYNTKYKDRAPEETIKIILDFFESNGFTIKYSAKNEFKETSIIWKVDLSLYYKNHYISTHGGKGVTKEFALASGLAELYERFCNWTPYLNLLVNKEVTKLNYEKNGFYFDKDEKQYSSIDEILKELDRVNWFSYYNYIKKHYDTVFKNYANLEGALNGHYVAVPYKSVFNSDVIYLNPILSNIALTTTGMAAGNTLEEALVQGISELFERKAIYNIFNNPVDTFYSVDKSIIKSEKLKQIIKELEAKNLNIIILDLSYNYNFPAVCTLIKNNETQDVFVNFGSNPIFEIAVERTLTEIYQAYDSFSNVDLIREVNTTLDVSFEDRLWNFVSGKALVNIVPISIWEDINNIKTFNTNIFLEANSYSNIELLNHLNTICNKNKFNFYYYDNSLINNMFAIQIVSPQVDFICCKYFSLDLARRALTAYNSNSISIQNITTLSLVYPKTSWFSLSTENTFDYELGRIYEIKTKKIHKDPGYLIDFYKLVLAEQSIYKKYFYKYFVLFRFYFIERLSKIEAKRIATKQGLDFSDDDWEICSDFDKLYDIIIQIRNDIFSQEFLDTYSKIFIK